MRTHRPFSTAPLLLLCLAALTSFAVVQQAGAGSLDPPGPPGGTMRSFEELHGVALALSDQMSQGSAAAGADPRSGLYVQFPGVPGDGNPVMPGSSKALATTHLFTVPSDPGTGQSTGTRNHTPMTVRFDLNESLVFLAQAYLQETVMGSVDLRWYRPDIASDYYRITLSQVRIVGLRTIMATKPGGFGQIVEVDLFYQTIAVEWTPDGVTGQDSWHSLP